MNKVVNVYTDCDGICFIIQTDNEPTYWWWEINKADWIAYWKKRNRPDCIISIRPWAANEFCNDYDNSMLGCSCGNFDTVLDAINDYKGE